MKYVFAANSITKSGKQGHPVRRT